MEFALIIIVAILVGGGINVLADDLPRGRFPRRPRYDDGSPRPIYTWLGLSAFLIELRRAKPPYSELNWRKPLTELALAGLMVIMQLVTGEDAPVPGGQRLIWQAYVAIFVLLAVVDLEHRRILIAPVILAAGLALVDAAFYPQQSPNLVSALAGGVCGGLCFWVVYLGGRFFGGLAEKQGVKKTVFGLGDVYLMGLAGLILGFPNVLAAMILAIFLGGAGALLYLAQVRVRGCQYERFTAQAYGPYILAATYVVMLFPSEISRLVFGL